MTEDVDQDTVLWARNVLLGSGRPSPRQEVDACRVLAKVSPATYLPRLSRALTHLGGAMELREKPGVQLALYEEASEAAYAMDEADPMRAETLLSALESRQYALLELGRRPEALAVREEMAAVSRRALGTDPDAPVRRWLGPWARALAEEGRHREAAELHEESVRIGRPHGAQCGAFAWSLLEWMAEAEAAGLRDTAVAATRELVEMERGEIAERDMSPELLLFALVRLGELRDEYGEFTHATAAYDEAAELLGGLAGGTSRGNQGSYLYSYWAVLFGLSGVCDEVAVPGCPGPPFGASVERWTRDVRDAHFGEVPALREAFDASSDPVARVRLHRRLRVRATLDAVHRRGYRYLDLVGPLFDEGVALARDPHTFDPAVGAAALARALFDRASAWITDKRFADAHADFQEALALRAAQR
ncbi:hypothetical protein ACFYWX_15555 [Streptomyces sp. NPDC002888]|uniref:hypothetical protein n=1 Tax=Streptomyces sp. NPDC002888 TaxID=3364668 RepID=UPI0036AAF043